MQPKIALYGYWRSSAVYRVRIALNLKGLDYETVPVNLIKDGGEQHASAYRDMNPQELVPALRVGDAVLHQSMAIIEYLEEAFPGMGARLLPEDSHGKARVRAMAQLIACDIHPLNNLRVMQYLERELQAPQAERDAWTKHWIAQGFAALEKILQQNRVDAYSHGPSPTMAEACLVPQVYNAYRFVVDMAPFPHIEDIYRRCLEHPAFAKARPENQVDAPT